MRSGILPRMHKSIAIAIRLLEQARVNAHKATGGKRMSTAARQRIAAAQRYRWKLWKECNHGFSLAKLANPLITACVGRAAMLKTKD